MRKSIYWLGNFGALFSILLVLISVLISPKFSWTNNYLSDIGAKLFGFIPYLLFSTGLIIGGIIFIIYFSLTAIEYKKHKVVFSAHVVFIVSSFSISMIAIFPEGSKYGLHYIFSFIFFFLFSIGMLLIGIVINEYLKRFAQGTFMLSSISLLLDISILLKIEKAMGEMLVSIIFAIWFIFYNYLMFKVTNIGNKDENGKNK
ncbi:MAG: DUF998 domain-containing protein [Thermoplasmata archaeon]